MGHLPSCLKRRVQGKLGVDFEVVNESRRGTAGTDSKRLPRNFGDTPCSLPSGYATVCLQVASAVRKPVDVGGSHNIPFHAYPHIENIAANTAESAPIVQ